MLGPRLFQSLPSYLRNITNESYEVIKKKNLKFLGCILIEPTVYTGHYGNSLPNWSRTPCVSGSIALGGYDHFEDQNLWTDDNYNFYIEPTLYVVFFSALYWNYHYPVLRRLTRMLLDISAHFFGAIGLVFKKIRKTLCCSGTRTCNL